MTILLDNSGPVITCFVYKVKIDEIEQHTIQRTGTHWSKLGKCGSPEQQDELIRTAFKHYSSISGLIGSTILYPEDPALITTMKYLDVKEPYEGTYIGYRLLNLILDKHPISFNSYKLSYNIEPVFDKTPRIRNHKMKDPDYGVVSLAWEHYTVRHE